MLVLEIAFVEPKVTSHLSLPGTEGFPRIWDIQMLELGKSWQNWKEMVTLITAGGFQASVA